MKFAVADDVLLARKAVEKLILEWDRDSTVCCSCDNGDEVLKVLEDQKVDVLVTDKELTKDWKNHLKECSIHLVECGK